MLAYCAQVLIILFKMLTSLMHVSDPINVFPYFDWQLKLAHAGVVVGVEVNVVVDVVVVVVETEVEVMVVVVVETEVDVMEVVVVVDVVVKVVVVEYTEMVSTSA